MNNAKSSVFRLAGSMFIFGTIGAFVQFIPLQSSVIALCRALIGALFLAGILLVRRIPVDFCTIRKNAVVLLLSGACLGFNWILLFESYRYTDNVAVSTLCYYMAPILIIMFSPILFRERLSLKKILCVACALAGMILISGVLQTGMPVARGQGVLFGLAAAVLYASVVILNKKLKNIDAFTRTVVQLCVSAAILLPYCFLTFQMPEEPLTPMAIVMLLTVGVLHTGIAYWLYFGSLEKISAQSAAIISYVDPVVAVVISATVLRQEFSLTSLLGALLILGAAMLSELPSAKG